MKQHHTQGGRAQQQVAPPDPHCVWWCCCPLFFWVVLPSSSSFAWCCPFPHLVGDAASGKSRECGKFHEICGVFSDLNEFLEMWISLDSGGSQESGESQELRRRKREGGMERIQVAKRSPKYQRPLQFWRSFEFHKFRQFLCKFRHVHQTPLISRDFHPKPTQSQDSNVYKCFYKNETSSNSGIIIIHP